MAERPVDIRETGAEDYWQTFEHKWTSLLTYRYLGKRTPGLDVGVDSVTMPLRHDMRNATGGIMAAPLCIASPESGGMADDLYVPNPVIASMQILDDARDVRTIAVLPETIKIGRSMGFSRSRVVDADDHSRLIALSEGMGVSLGGTPGSYEQVENPPIDVVDSPDLPPLHEVFGASRREPGVWQLGELVEELASPDAALHLGPQHVVLETAAAELAAQHAGTADLQIESWHVMFVARGKIGPFRASGEAFPGRDGRVASSVSLFDEGNGDRIVTSAAAVFRPA
jgi:hypothetical protein